MEQNEKQQKGKKKQRSSKRNKEQKEKTWGNNAEKRKACLKHKDLTKKRREQGEND